MRRLLPVALALAAVLGLAFAGPADASSAAPPKTYTVTRTYGPYNGQANLQNGLPGQVPDGEALAVFCNNLHDSIVVGTAKINRKTAHGTSRVVLTLDVIGAFWDTEDDRLKWGAFVNATGRKGWNSVTFTITCHR
jgi:hypothetical protein